MAIRECTPGGASIGQALRRRIFLYQDGVVLAATLRAFDALGLLTAPDGVSIATLCPDLPESGFAHLRVGIRSLAQAGWLADGPGLSPESTMLRWTEAGRSALESGEDYLALGAFLARFDSPEPDGWQRPWSDSQRADLAALSALRWANGDPIRAAHLDGALLTPVLLAAEARREEPDAALLEATGLGADWRQIVAHLGLAGSYLPLLARLPDLYRGEPLAPGGHPREWHVQRELNIRASTAAHHRYFADAGALIRAVLDRPLAEQPALLLDTGCGDGAWLARAAALLPETLRGRHLAQYPLRLVGADHEPAAIEKARASLAGAGVGALVVQGDVSDPEALSATLAGHGLDMADALHLHAFIDHDRSFRGSGETLAPLSTGAFIGPHGEVLAPERVEADLTAHLARWAPYTRRHGLIALEAHCVPPQAATHQQGALHSIAFDAYHAYSRQYPLERGAYIEAVRRAGLRPAATGGRCYPSNRPFVAVSLNHLLGGEALALPVPVVEEADDGLALHRLLYRDGDIRHPRPWCAPATNALVSRAMGVLETHEGNGPIRICDYGTGTGLAAIELLKACRERGFGKRIELLCLDIPSPWFAYGQALLGGMDSVTFHPLTDSRGFRPLAEALEGKQADLILASMVFHLIRPEPLARVAGELAGVLAPGGTLLWNAPDIGPAGPCAVLFHDENRMLRARWEAMLAGEITPETEAQREAMAGAEPLDSARAGRRILPVANDAGAVGAALSRRVEAASSVAADAAPAALR
jgi:SAM-dependent methyltransferase